MSDEVNLGVYESLDGGGDVEVVRSTGIGLWLVRYSPDNEQELSTRVIKTYYTPKPLPSPTGTKR